MLSKNSLFSVLFTLLLYTQVLAYDLKYSADILLNGEPSAVAVNPSSDTAAVISKASPSLTVIDLVTAAAIHEIPLPAVPVGLAVHRASNRAIVATGPGTLLSFDLETGQAVGTVETGEAIRALGVDEARGVLLVGTDEGLRQVELSGLDLQPEPVLAGEVTHIMPGKASCAVVVKEDETFRLQVLDAEGVLQREVALPGEPVGLGLAEPLGLLLVVEKEKPGVQLYDLATLEAKGEIPTDRPVRQLAVNPSTHRAYLVDAEGNLTVIDLQGKRLVETVRLFEQVGSFGIDVARNAALVGHGPNLAIVQLENPVPELTRIMPEESAAGAKGVQLAVSGSRFIRDSSTHFNGQPLPTGFDSNEHLTATIPPSELELPGNVAVAVHNPPPGGGISNELTFKILTPLPQVTAVAPATVAVGGSAFTLRVVGKNFMPASSVSLGTQHIDARFVSSTVLEAVVGASLIAAEGVYPVSVTNGGETSLTSNAAPLAVIAADEIPAEGGAATVSLGTGSLAGRILNTEMWPVEGVTIKVKGRSAQTDANGAFRLDGIPAGKRTLLMDGSTAREADGHYPTIPITVDITANTVNPLPFQPYLHRQKARNFVPIDPGRDTILTDPEVPGFEMRIPAGVNITGWDGKRNLKVSVRTVPADRLPIKPLPKNSYARTVYMFYFDKVGGGVADRPIPFKARNDLGLLPGEKAVLWYYDESPEEGMAPNDWAIAGTGTVTPDGQYIVTDPGTGIPKFCCGATSWGGGSPPPGGSPGGGGGDGDGKGLGGGDGLKRCVGDVFAGDPVDTSTGYFFYHHTDLTVPGILPVKIGRYYRSRDGGAAVTGTEGLGAFGKGTYLEQDWWLGDYGEMLRLIKPGNFRYDFVKQPDGTYKNTANPEFRGAVVTYDAVADTRTLKMPDGTRYTFAYQNRMSGELAEIADRNGNKLLFTRRPRPQYDFDQGGYLYEVRDGGGNLLVSFSQSYVGGNFFRTDAVTDKFGRSVRYTYEADPFSSYPRLKKVEYPGGGTIQYGYDGQGRMNAITNPRGVMELFNEYDADHRVVRQTHADGGVNTFSYTVAGGFVTETQMTYPNGAQKTWRFNSSQYLTEAITPDGTTTYQRAAGTNELQSVTDPLGRITRYTYYSTTDAANGKVRTVTDPLGNITTYEYEATYGLPTKITDALGKITTFAYTFDAGRVARVEMRDPLQNLTAIDYDGYGMPTRITDPNNNATSFAYDPANPGKLTAVSDALGNSLSYGYDALGRLATVTDAKGATTTYDYDPADRVKSTTDPLGSLTRYYYDANGNLTWLIDPKGGWLKYEYDDRDRVTKMTDQLGRVETYAYYRDLEITPTTGDNLKSITDRKGQTTTFDEYDPAWRLKQVTFGDGSTVQYAYDLGGRVTSIADSLSGAISYAYNDFGCGTCSGSGVDQIAEETTSAGTVAYTYDKVGRRLTMTVPGAPLVTYGYDDAGRLININRTIGGTARDFAIAYDPAGRRTSVQLPLYKSKGKWQYLNSTYDYDIANHLTSLLHQNPTGTIENLTYTYDPNGNRKSANRSAAIPLETPLANATYDEANEMLSFDGKSLTYDDNGNLVTRTDACGTTNYIWDARNRLTGINGYNPDCTQLTASFRYDALNRRIEKIINGTSTQYVYDGWDIVKETSGSLTTNYTCTLNIDEPLAFERSDGTVRFYQADALGSIIALTDGNGVVTTTYAYDAFGSATTSGSDVNPFQYTGRENDGTGLYYYRARYYSPGMRRFISEDPIRLMAGINFYSYVQNNPIVFTDPLGLYGSGSCTYYQQACTANGGRYECGLAQTMCPDFPTGDQTLGNFSDCVRQCLQERHKDRMPDRDSCSDRNNIDVSDNAYDHAACISGCSANSENPYNPFGPNLPDNDVSLY